MHVAPEQGNLSLAHLRAHIVTGLWLMYLTFATVLDITSGHTLAKA
jgi:hypothetical protein